MCADDGRFLLGAALLGHTHQLLLRVFQHGRLDFSLGKALQSRGLSLYA